MDIGKADRIQLASSFANCDSIACNRDWLAVDAVSAGGGVRGGNQGWSSMAHQDDVIIRTWFTACGLWHGFGLVAIKPLLLAALASLTGLCSDCRAE